MTKEFIPYEQALELKELGYDEPCFAWFCNNELTTSFNDLYPKERGERFEIMKAPTFSQAFRWFREKYDLYMSIVHYENGYSINDLRRFDTYEEAELACLKELIKQVKNK